MSGHNERPMPHRLLPGERILWHGRPCWRAVVRDALHLRLVALYLSAAIVWGAVDDRSQGLGLAEAELRWLVAADPSDAWARHALGRSLERQSRYADALPHLRLAAAMTGDPEHETAVLRVERRLAETGATSYDGLR